MRRHRRDGHQPRHPEGPLASLRHDGDGIGVTEAGKADFDKGFCRPTRDPNCGSSSMPGSWNSAAPGHHGSPLPIVHAPVTLTVANAAATPLLNRVSKLTVDGVGTTRRAALSGQP